MYQHDSGLSQIYLKPGEIFVGATPAAVTTVLGSCVSVVLFSRRFRMGAICHALLPSGGQRADGMRYVDCSIRRMLEEYRKHGIGHHEIEAKLFGGSDMFSSKEGFSLNVGKQNIQKALAIIEEEGLDLVASDIGGVSSRKIVFLVHSGEVFLKRHKEIP